MGIWEWVALKSEAVKRDAPDATPVKNSCRNSYNRSSTAFAKIDQTVRTIVLRRVAQRTPADEIPAKEAETDRGVLDANSMKNGGTSSCAYGYGFIAFAKLGYTVRVKGIYRIVHWMKNDGTKSITTIYTTNFAQNAELHESNAGDELIPGQAFVMPMEKECMNSYTFGFITFARIGYVVRVNVHRFGQWMADDDTKARMAMYSTIFAKNICRYALQDFNKLMIPGGVGVAVFIILSNTLIDIIHEHQKLSKEKWIDSTAEAVKRNTPDATPVKNAFKNTYTYGGAAFSKIDHWMPDDETKSKIGIITAKFAQNSAQYALYEGFKLIPGGGAVSKIVSKTINDVEYENLKLKKKAKSAEEELSVGSLPAADETPEDVIRVFMMKEFFGTRFFDDLMLSQIATKKKNK